MSEAYGRKVKSISETYEILWLLKNKQNKEI